VEFVFGEHRGVSATWILRHKKPRRAEKKTRRAVNENHVALKKKTRRAYAATLATEGRRRSGPGVFLGHACGAELDLLLLRHGRRWGIEFQASAAPEMSNSGINSWNSRAPTRILI
jgi:hypothetical protein